MLMVDWHVHPSALSYIGIGIGTIGTPMTERADAVVEIIQFKNCQWCQWMNVPMVDRNVHTSAADG